MNSTYCRSKSLIEREIYYFIKSLPEKKKYSRKLRSEIINSYNSPDPERPPNANVTMKNSVVEHKVVKLTEIEADIKCIEDAFNAIPTEYRDILYNYFYKGKSLLLYDHANIKTLYKYRRMLVLLVAQNKGYDLDFIEFIKNEIK